MVEEALEWATERVDQLDSWAHDRYGDTGKAAAVFFIVLAGVGILPLLILFCLAVMLAGGLIIAIFDAAAYALGKLGSWQVTQIVTHPVKAYITTHATGLAASADVLWIGWIAASIALWTLALFRSWGARIGWIIYGTSTAAMVWAATPTHNRALATGVTAIYWALLSIPAFKPRPRTIVVYPPAPAPAPTDNATSD